MKIIVYTSFDCLIKTDFAQEALEANEHLVIENKPNSLAVYPTGKNKQPSFEVNFEEDNSPYYRIVEKDDKILIFLLDGIFTQNIKVYSLSCDGRSCQVEIGKNEVAFISSGNKKVLSLPEPALTSKCGHFYHIAYAKIDTENMAYLLAYNTKNHQAKILKGGKIELTDEGFVVTSSAHGYKKIEEEYVVKKEGLKIKERTFSTLGLPTFEQALPFRFLNSVKHGDFNFALSLLSNDLKSSLTEKTLRDYFGNLSYIFPIDESTCFAISDNSNKIYSFTIANNKICEIND